jgi:hypothetical protein
VKGCRPGGVQAEDFVVKEAILAVRAFEEGRIRVEVLRT